MNTFADRLLVWFDHHGRHDLPWQHGPTPYKVWVSEIMLQQTQVQTVIPYFRRFMERFPTLAQLAEAPQDDVLAVWTGLGYYSRARNLHLCSQRIMEQYKGVLPDQVDKLVALPGIGVSTAGAIMSQVFNQPVAILDGNVKRVLTRFYGIEGWPGQGSVEKQLWKLAIELTPDYRNADYTQAIMDLGATLCKRTKPLCSTCPMQHECQALAQDKVTQIPTPKPAKSIPTKRVYCPVFIDHQQAIYLEKRPSSGIWGGLWSLPEFASKTDLYHYLATQGIDVTPMPMMMVKHAFSHYKLMLYPYQVILQNQPLRGCADDSCQWHAASKINTIGLPAPIKRILQECWQDS